MDEGSRCWRKWDRRRELRWVREVGSCWWSGCINLVNQRISNRDSRLTARCREQRNVFRTIHRDWDTMKITISNITSKASFPTPSRVRCQRNLSDNIRIHIIDVQLQWLSLISLYESNQIISLMKDTFSSENIIGVCDQSCEGSWRVWLHRNNVPHVLTGSVERAETNRNSEKSLSSPVLRRDDTCLANCLRFAVVNSDFERFLDMLLQHFFHCIIVLIQSDVSNRDNEIEKWFQTSHRSWRVLLNSKNMISFSPTARNRHTFTASHFEECSNLGN